MTTPRSVRAAIKQWRNRSGLSLKNAQIKTGVNYKAIGRFEKGGQISMVAFLKLAAFVERRK